jgi:Rod binding domain-containing protein
MDALPVDNNITGDSLFKTQIDSLSKYESLGSGNKTNLTDKQKADIAKASRGFESMFINMMLKEMKKGMLGKDEDGQGGEDNLSGEGGGSMGSFGASTLQGYVDMLWSDEISKQGTGIGIADMLYTQLSGGDKLKPITVEMHSQKMPAIASNQYKQQQQSSSELTIPTVADAFMNRVNGRIDNYDNIISEASKKYSVPESLIKAIITVESAGKTDAKSQAGAKGLMQLMDGTAQDMGVTNPFDPVQNIHGGAKYLRTMLDKFGNNLDHALAAYNAGPGNVEKYGGVPPFNETQAYVKRVQKYNDIFQNTSSQDI